MVGLSAYEGCPRDALRGATRRAFERAIAAAIEERASVVLIAGDLYDGAWKDYSTGLYFVSQMRRLREAGIPVVLLRGNHDAESQIAKTLPPQERVYELSTKAPETVEIEGLDLAVHGRGFPRRDVREDFAKTYPRAIPGCFNVGLLHTALGGREGHEPYAPTSVEVLIDRGYDYWALGHIHRREVVLREPWIVYPGNLQGRHVRETGPKGFSVVQVEEGRVVSVEHRAVDTVRWVDATIEAPLEGGRDELLDRVRRSIESAVREAEGRTVAMRLTVGGATQAHTRLARSPEAFEADVRALGLDLAAERLWLSDLVLETRSPIDRATLESSSDPLAMLLRATDGASIAPELSAALSSALDELREKLPEEMRQDPELAFLDDPTKLPLADVRELLIARLLAGEDGAG